MGGRRGPSSAGASSSFSFEAPLVLLELVVSSLGGACWYISLISRSSIDSSTSSPQAPRMNPEWMAAATGSESSVYTPVPHKARRAQISSRWLVSIRKRGTRTVKVQFSRCSKRGRGWGVLVYPNLELSAEAFALGTPMRGVYRVEPRWCRGRCATLDSSGSRLTVVRGSRRGGTGAG